MVDVYGLLKAAPDARGWLPTLSSEGQRLVLAVLTLHVGTEHSVASPSAEDLAKLCGFHPSSVRRILEQLEDGGVVTRVGSRPVFVNGTAKGGRVPVWAVNTAPSNDDPNRASEGAYGRGSQARPTSVPSAPYKRPKRASEGAPYEVLKCLKGGGDSRGSPPPLCPTCGSVLEYDASKDVNVCPRCGETP
jgi:hypothetical protein